MARRSARLAREPFDADAYVEQVDDLIGTFSSENLALPPRPELRSEVSVFVASMPRAGSTLAPGPAVPGRSPSSTSRS